MTDQSPTPQQPTAITDSPWFWAMLFCAAALVSIVLILPRYGPRQRRLEMQYQAHQERYRRQVAGEPALQTEPEQGFVAPPAADELIIPLWPLVTLFVGLLAATGYMLRRTRQRGPGSLGGKRHSGTPP